MSQTPPPSSRPCWGCLLPCCCAAAMSAAAVSGGLAAVVAWVQGRLNVHARGRRLCSCQGSTHIILPASAGMSGRTRRRDPRSLCKKASLFCRLPSTSPAPPLAVAAHCGVIKPATPVALQQSQSTRLHRLSGLVQHNLRRRDGRREVQIHFRPPANS